MKRIFAPALEPGDTIALVAPAGLLNRTRTEVAIKRIEEEGFKVKQYRDIYRSRGYLAGDDETRAKELMQAFADPEVSAVFPVRGGTGVTRILDSLDYGVIRRNPKILTGFSDITALHLAIQRQAGLVTFHSPNPMDGFGRTKGFTKLSSQTFWRALLADSYRHSQQEGYEVLSEQSERDKLSTLITGIARGQLVGGNLSLVCAVMGTPYEIETRGNILFLEDVAEAPYRIDRLLSQLRLAGKLEMLDGILLGKFSRCDAGTDEESLSLAEVFDDYFADLGVPVLQNFPAGHSSDNVTLPLGVEVELDADHRQLTILESPVTLRR